MTNKQIWLVGTDMSGRTTHGASNTVIDFDLVTEVGSRLVPGANQVLFCFRKKQQTAGAAAYIHAYEPDFNRPGGYAGVGIEFPLDQVPSIKGIFSCFEYVMKLYHERLERSANNIFTFKKSLSGMFPDWERLKADFAQKLENKEALVCPPVVNEKAPVIVCLPNSQLVVSCFAAFLQQNVYEEMYLTTDATFECFKSYVNIDMNELLLQGFTHGNIFMSNILNSEREKWKQNQNQLRQELVETQKNHTVEREKLLRKESELRQELAEAKKNWQQQEAKLQNELQLEQQNNQELTRECDSFKQKINELNTSGNKFFNMAKNSEQRLKQSKKLAQETRQLITNYRKDFLNFK